MAARRPCRGRGSSSNRHGCWEQQAWCGQLGRVQQPGSSQQQQVPPAAPAGTIPIAALQQQWRVDLEHGELLLTPGALDRQLQGSGVAAATPEAVNSIKASMMGDHNPLIADALRLQESKQVVWRGAVLSLQQKLSGLVAVGEPEFTPSEIKAKDGLRQKMTATAIVRLAAGAQQPLADAEQFPLSSAKDFAARQPMEAAFLRVQVSNRAPGVFDRRKRKPAAAARAQEELQRQLLPVLYANIAALLKWQLVWQLKAEQRQHLQANGFELLQVAPTAAVVDLAPTLGLGRTLHVQE